jgi:hypothetical protein
MNQAIVGHVVDRYVRVKTLPFAHPSRIREGTEEGMFMAQRTTLDAMIPREDFAKDGEDYRLDLFQGLSTSNLESTSPILKLLRKPDFQRETNHWTPDQFCTFIASFVDNEVIPSLILWKSPSHIFVIDGGHRLSALRAWMENDYGDGPRSLQFYNGEIPAEQRKIAKKTRKLIEKRVGTYEHLKSLVDNTAAQPEQRRRADTLVTRALPVQWIQGSAAVAETSFFKINTQGTALDEVEEMLIRNRKRPISIAARAILRAGSGHKYWSNLPKPVQIKIEELANEFYRLVFEPEIDVPVKTLDLPLGGSTSPVDALVLLIEFLAIAGSKDGSQRLPSDYPEESDGNATVEVLKNSFAIIRRITGNSPESLGLHPAIYFYNERGRYSRFLFLGISMLIAERIRHNDDNFFRKFTIHREKMELFLIDNRSLIGIVLQNLGKTTRITKMRDMFSFLIAQFQEGEIPKLESVMGHLGLKSRIIDVVSSKGPADFSDDTKSMIYIRQAVRSSLICPHCKGKLDPKKSVSYDHILPKRNGGSGDPENGDLTHPYCNSIRR